MSLIANEVNTFADRRGWKWQVRRAWTARERPVKESDIFDYEWKLLPDDMHGYYVRRSSATDPVLASERGSAVNGTSGHGERQPVRPLRLDRHRDRGIGWDVSTGSIALANWLMIMTDRYDPNWYSVT